MNEREMYALALQISSPDERAAFLDKACAADATLNKNLRELLAINDNVGSFLEAPAAAVATIDRSPSEQPGTQIGRYKLLEQVGEGGMGIVFVAEQTEPVRRRVALKIIKPGMDTKQVIARFEAERQALAMMDHPNIAKVLDAGATETGRPYFVMELVRGLPITEYCDKARLSPRQRLELIIDVCHAVQHAHQKGIIHRDLKPSNVMITVHDGRPIPKVIDFGVAKAVGQQLTERTVYTAHTQLVGTPLYMSPEQADFSSQDVDTRSDVYSLGVLLYELLTGQTPFDKEALHKAGFDEMRRIIREDDPPRPSHRISTLGAQASSTVSQQRGVDERHLGRILFGELDWIVMKALEKDRSRRYESASALATDIQRYLSDEPVLACPPTAMYRFHKFARKHKPAFVTAAAIAACLLLGTTVSAWQAIRATTAEAQANANEQKAVVNEQKANANASQAEAKAQEATEQRDEAQRQRDEVKALNDKLLAAQAETRETLYAAHMNLALSAWKTSSLRRMRGLLDLYLPKSGQPDLRGFEWYYLAQLHHPELLRFTHGISVASVAFSPDGKRLASESTNRAVKVWDVQSQKELLTFAAGPDNRSWDAVGRFHHVAFTADGNRIAAEGTLWDAQTGKSLRGSPSPGGVLSPDGTRVASRHINGRVMISDAQSRKELSALKGHSNAIVSIAFSPDSKHLATASWDHTVMLWDVATGKALRTFKEHTRRVWSVAFSPDGKRLAAGSGGRGESHPGLPGDIKVWNIETGEEILSIPAHSQYIFALAFSADGKSLASGSGDCLVKVWNSVTGAELRQFKSHSGIVQAVSFSPDGKRLASGSTDGTIRVWELDDQRRSDVTVLGGEKERLCGLAISPDGKRVASAVDTQGFSYATWASPERWETRPATVKIFDIQTGQEQLALHGHTAMVSCVGFSPDGKRLASGSIDKTVRVWDVESGRELYSLSGHDKMVRGVVFSPDGRFLATAADDGRLKLWDVQSRQTVHTLATTRNPLTPWPVNTPIAFTTDSKRLATCSEEEISIWDVDSGKSLLTLKIRSPSKRSLAFSPDGKYLACANFSEIRVWESETGSLVNTWDGHNMQVYGVSFSPDGRRLASISQDGTVKVWNPQIAQETLTLEGHFHHVCNVAFTPDGSRLVTNGSDGTVRIWNGTPLPESP